MNSTSPISLTSLLHRPTAVLLTTLAALLLGILAAGKLPLSLLPEVGIPRISVQVSYPNAAARTVEDAVVAPLRNTLLQVNRLTDIRSRAREEAAVLYLEFPFGTDPNLAFIEVNEKIDQAMSQLPRDVERPRVLATDVGDIPVVQLSVTLRPGNQKVSSDEVALLELSDLTRNVLRRRLEQLDEIAFADYSGQREPRLLVRPDQSALRALGLTDADLAKLLSDANVELGGLLLADGPNQYAVRFTGNLRTADDLRKLYLTVGGLPTNQNSTSGPARTLPLSDLATVTYEAEPARGGYLHNGEPGIVFTIRKRADARLFELREHLNALVTDLEADYPALRFQLDNDQTAVLRASVDNLTGGLLYGAGFAILVLFAFFREWQRPLLIGLAVPVALLIAVLGFYLAGLSINVISLAGLILGLGLMIDNSIIVLDNIASYRAPGGPTDQRTRVAAATNEVIRPLLSSALTTVAVFLPLVLLSGIAGALFRDQAIAVTLSLAASLLVAYFLLPMLSVLLSRNKIPVKNDELLPPRPDNSEAKSLTAYRISLIAYPLLFLSWLALGYLILSALPTRGFPEISRTDYQLSLDWNESLPYDLHRTRARALMNDWRTRFGGDADVLIGENQFQLSEENQATNAATFQFFLPAAPANGFADEWIAQQRQKFPTASFAFRPVANLFDRIFLNDAPYVEARLRAADSRETPAWKEVQPLLDGLQTAGFQPVPPPRNEAVSLRINYAALNTSRVDDQRLRARLLTLFNENEVTRLRTSDRALPVLLAGADELTTERLLAATVTNRDGNEIPLRYLITTERQPDYRVLTADGAGEYLALPFPGEPTEAEVSRIESTLNTFPDFTTQLSGRFLTDRTRVGELGGVLLVSLLLLYLILAAQFEGLRLPFVVLLVVPVSLVGSLIALWITGSSLNLISLIGMVVTGGIVVNDAIIKVDMIERGRAAGLAMSAAIQEASRRRLRAIVMTSLTTILALAPVLFTAGLGAELQQPLAITVIGGLIVGTLGSLYVVPLLYRLFSGAAVVTERSRNAGAGKG